MKNINKMLIPASFILCSQMTFASEADITVLEQKVEQSQQQINQQGIILTTSEIEHITAQVIDEEIATTGLSVAEAVEKYQLTPTQARYLKLKKALRNGQVLTSGNNWGLIQSNATTNDYGAGNGGGLIPPNAISEEK